MSSTTVLQAIRAWTGARNVVSFRRGTTAAYYAYRHCKRRLAHDDASIILPSICCPSLMNAAWAAGLTIKWADVEPDDGVLAYEAVERLLDPTVCAVLYIHLFGAVHDLTDLSALCAANGAMLIEDCAHAPGGATGPGNMAGSFGDFSVFSFMPSKVYECGGGAMSVREPVAYESILNDISSTKDSLYAMRSDHDQRTREYRDLLDDAWKCSSEDANGVDLAEAATAFTPLYLLRDEVNTLGAMIDIDKTLKPRCALAEQYEDALYGGPWRILDGWRRSGVCWRLAVQLDPGLNNLEIAAWLRREGFHASNLFRPLHVLFDRDARCTNAIDFGKRIVNLWVDSSVDSLYVDACSQSMWRAVERSLVG